MSAQQARDGSADVERELGELAGRLGLEPQPAADPLPEEERAALLSRVERLRAGASSSAPSTRSPGRSTRRP